MILSYFMSKLLSVSVPDELPNEAEEAARAQGKTKSEVVREALRSHLATRRLRELQAYARERAERRGLGPEDVEDLIDDLRSKSR